MVPTLTTYVNSSTCLEFKYNSEENLIIGTFEADEDKPYLYTVEFSYDEVADQMDEPYYTNISNIDYLYKAFDGKGTDSDDYICECIGYALAEKVQFGNLALFASALKALFWDADVDKAKYYLDQWLNTNKYS